MKAVFEKPQVFVTSSKQGGDAALERYGCFGVGSDGASSLHEREIAWDESAGHVQRKAATFHLFDIARGGRLRRDPSDQPPAIFRPESSMGKSYLAEPRLMTSVTEPE